MPTKITVMSRYENEGQRFETLRQIESLVQSKTSDPTEQKKERRRIVQKNPDIFYQLYKDFELSPERKSELQMALDACLDRLVLNRDLMDRLVNFGLKDSKDKLTLCQDVVTWLIRDSGIKPFQTSLPDINVVVKPMDDGINGYNTGKEIGINQKRLNLEGTGANLFQTLMHETLHTTQKEGQNTFTELSSLYYVDSSVEKYNGAWNGKVTPAYLGQPIEKEAWFFGISAGNRMSENYHTSSKINTVIQSTITTLTGEKCSINDAKHYQQKSGGAFEISLPQKISGDISINPYEVPHFFGSEAYCSNAQNLVFKMTENETCEQLLQRISDGTKKLSKVMQDREQLKKRIQELFPETKVLPNKRKDGLLLESSNSELQEWIQSMGTNVTTKVTQKGNLWIHLPLILQKDGKETTYAQSFPVRFTNLSDQKHSYRVLLGGDGKMIIPDALRQKNTDPPKKAHSMYDLLSDSANGGQGMDNHKAIDYRDVVGKDKKEEIPPPILPTNALKAEREHKREEILKQFGIENQIAIKRGNSL